MLRPRLERCRFLAQELRHQVQSTDSRIPCTRRFKLADQLRVKSSLNSRVDGRDIWQARGVDNLVGRLPHVRKLCHGLRLGCQSGIRLPHGHRFVHSLTVEVCTNGAHNCSDESENLVTRGGPFDGAMRVFDVAVEGHVRHIHHFCHCAHGGF